MNVTISDLMELCRLLKAETDAEIERLKEEIVELEAGLQAIRNRSNRILDGKIETLVIGHADYCAEICNRVLKEADDE